ncbi:MAG: EamA family transporter RarD [Anaerolineae bacterium]|nr:EamA family transporter RarD [Thermoflexales bacterium]MDW8395512.1 EamA family transporter RarD [Anaerolineae bacterium]
MAESRYGLLLAGGAYVLWGFLPAYLKLLAQLAPTEILAHRIVWSLAFCSALLALRGGWAPLLHRLRQPRVLGWFVLSAACLSVNWLLYIWAVNTGQVVEGSLGYFIIPIVNAAFGVLLLGERLRAAQVTAFALAAAGAAYLTVAYGQFPWIGLTLALTFGVYGLLRKRAALESLPGLTLEMAMVSPVALGYLFVLGLLGEGTFGRADWSLHALLLAAGPVTAVPLLLFAAGIRRVALTTLGVLQYLGPSIQFLLGVFAYGEPFNLHRLIGFCLIWVAMAIFAAEGLLRYRTVDAARAARAERQMASG